MTTETTIKLTLPELSFADYVAFYRDEVKRRTNRRPSVKDARRAVLLAQAHGLAAVEDRRACALTRPLMRSG